MEEKRISLRLYDKQLSSIKKVTDLLHIDISAAIRLFIDKDKIVIVEEYKKLIPVLIDMTVAIEEGADDSLHKKLHEEVESLWQSLNLLIANQN